VGLVVLNITRISQIKEAWERFGTGNGVEIVSIHTIGRRFATAFSDNDENREIVS
jgi:hypothetical protein